MRVEGELAHAIGGRRLAVDASSEEVSTHKIERWENEWDGTTFRKELMRKVLTPMKSPDLNCVVEPLACYWNAMHPDGEDEPFFTVSLKDNEHFTQVSVFSMSAYLRNLHNQGTDRLELEMHDTVSRLEWINRLFKV